MSDRRVILQLFTLLCCGPLEADHLIKSDYARSMALELNTRELLCDHTAIYHAYVVQKHRHVGNKAHVLKRIQSESVARGAE